MNRREHLTSTDYRDLARLRGLRTTCEGKRATLGLHERFANDEVFYTLLWELSLYADDPTELMARLVTEGEPPSADEWPEWEDRLGSLHEAFSEEIDKLQEFQIRTALRWHREPRQRRHALQHRFR